MTIAIIAIGIPGSGKTTVLKRLADEYGLVYINKDAIRAEMLGDINDQSRNRDVWLESDRRTREALRGGQSVALDSTYAERWKRKELATSLRRYGADKVIGLYFNVPFERAVLQNKSRERVISDKEMDWMRRQVSKAPPIVEEGFDELYTLSELSSLEKELRFQS